MAATPKGTWLTNHPRTHRGWFPRRDARMRDGIAKPTEEMSVQDLESRFIVGVYLDEDVPEGIENRPMLTCQK